MRLLKSLYDPAKIATWSPKALISGGGVHQQTKLLTLGGAALPVPHRTQTVDCNSTGVKTVEKIAYSKIDINTKYVYITL